VHRAIKSQQGLHNTQLGILRRNFKDVSCGILNFLERDENRGPWPASVILIGLDWIVNVF